ncbi:MAG: hypothetical protein K2X54_10900, partial [Methylobacterium organophilum]|nr:hypothetical protein [Methylobacterium organophilum]
CGDSGFLGDPMKCQVVQNEILALPDPRHLPPELGAHVAGCAECHAWARKVARLGALLAQLPAPAAPAGKKDALLGELLEGEPVVRPRVAGASRPSSLVVADFLRRNVRVVAGLAAAVLVVVGGWWVARPKAPPPEMVESEDHPFLKQMAGRTAALARADAADKRLEILSGMAGDIAGETRTAARVSSAGELNDLARNYERVVKEGVVPQAKALPPTMPAAERRRLIESLAAKLEADAVEADRLHREAPQDAQPTLKRVAEAARDGARELARAEGK